MYCIRGTSAVDSLHSTLSWQTSTPLDLYPPRINSTTFPFDATSGTSSINTYSGR